MFSLCTIINSDKGASSARVLLCVFLDPTIPAPPRAIFTTSGWPLLTHHGRPLSPTGFSSRVKNDNRHPVGCEVSYRNGWYPGSVHFCLRVHRAPMASHAQRGEVCGVSRNANKNAWKKGRPWLTLRVISRAPNNNGRQTFRADVDSCSPERALRARNICIIAAILTPFDAECIWSLPFEASLPPPSALMPLALAPVKRRLQARCLDKLPGSALSS